MRLEAKVYLSHTDMARVQEAARRGHETLSGYMRRVALLEADRLFVPKQRSVLDGQLEIAGAARTE